MSVAVRRLVRLVDSLHVDVIQSLLYRANVLGAIAARLSRSRPTVIAGQRSLTPMHGRSPAIAARLARRWTFRTVAVSAAVRRAVVRREGADPKTISVIPNGVDTERYRPHPHSRTDIPVTIGAVGRLTRTKGFDVLLGALTGVRDREERVRLVVVGDGPEHENLSEQARSSGIDGIVRFAG